MSKSEKLIHPPGVIGQQLESGYPPGILGYLDDHELAKPERLELLRRFGIPQAPFEDYEIRETGPGLYSFIDRATGKEYRRGPDPTIQAPGASDCVCFTVDRANRLHYLRPRGPKAPDRTIWGEVIGREIR